VVVLLYMQIDIFLNTANLIFSFFFSSRRRHTRSYGDWSSDVCSSDLQLDDYSALLAAINAPRVVDEIPTLKLPVHIREKARKRMRAAGVRLDRPLFGLHAGGLYGQAKHWGDERYGEVAERLLDDGYSVVML